MSTWCSGLVARTPCILSARLHSTSCDLSAHRRAKYLLDGAQHVMDSLGGKFPETAAGLLGIPGRTALQSPDTGIAWLAVLLCSVADGAMLAELRNMCVMIYVFEKLIKVMYVSLVVRAVAVIGLAVSVKLPKCLAHSPLFPKPCQARER